MSIQDKRMLLEPEHPKRQKYILYVGVYYVHPSRE